MSQNSESELRHRRTLTDQYQDRAERYMSDDDNNVLSNCDTREAISGLASSSLSSSRKHTGESNELEIIRRSGQPFLTRGMTVLLLLGLVSSLLMYENIFYEFNSLIANQPFQPINAFTCIIPTNRANMYLDSHKMIKYENDLGELRLQLLQKELELKDLQAQIAQQRNRHLDDHVTTVREVNKKLDDVAGKYEKENNDLKAKNEELELAIARRKNFYMKENGDSELHLAAYWRDEKAVKQLVEKGADLNVRNNLLETPLYQAAVGKDKMMGLRIIKYLIANGADVSFADYRRFTFLHQLVDSGTTITPLQFHDISAFLIGKKLTKLFDATESIYESTPLHLAVRDLEVEQRTLSLLHKNGVNFRAVNKMGNSLLTYAAEGRRSLQFLSNLIKFGQDWMHLNKANQSLLHITAEFGNEEALQFFMQKGGLDVNAKDVEGNTPMHIAVLRSLRIVSVVETVKVLIMNGANLKIANKMGVTPLQIVLKREDIPDKFKVTELLIKNER